MVKKTLDEMLKEIQDETNHRNGDAEWIVDAYNHLFGENYDFVDFLSGD